LKSENQMMRDGQADSGGPTGTHTHTHTLPHPLPLPLLVEQDDDQLGVHLVPVLAERQVTPLERHVHQVPAEGDMEQRDGGGRSLSQFHLLYTSVPSSFKRLSSLTRH